MKVKKGNLLIILLSVVFLIFYMTREDSLGDLWQAVRGASPVWLGGALFLMGGYWLLEALILHLPVKKFHGGQRFWTTLKTSMIGQFFNCVTPFSSGGQPMQAYHMVKSGVPLGSAGCSLMVKFIVYQFVLTLYSAVTLLLRFQVFSAKITGMGVLVLAGFGINTAVILGLLGVCFFSRQAKSFLLKMVQLLARWRWVKDEAETKNYVCKELDGFYNGFQTIKKNPGMIVPMAALSVVQLTGYFMIPYCIFRAFRLGEVSALTMLSAEAFVLNISSFVPLPGAAGGAELSFHTMFGLFFPAGLLNLSIFLWRLITFYLPICVGMLFTFGISKEEQQPKKQAALLSKGKTINCMGIKEKC